MSAGAGGMVSGSAGTDAPSGGGSAGATGTVAAAPAAGDTGGCAVYGARPIGVGQCLFDDRSRAGARTPQGSVAPS